VKEEAKVDYGFTFNKPFYIVSKMSGRRVIDVNSDGKLVIMKYSGEKKS